MISAVTSPVLQSRHQLITGSSPLSSQRRRLIPEHMIPLLLASKPVVWVSGSESLLSALWFAATGDDVEEAAPRTGFRRRSLQSQKAVTAYS